MIKVISSLSVALVFTAAIQAETGVALGKVNGQISPGKFTPGVPVSFELVISNELSMPIIAMANGFRIYSDDGATWSPAFSFDTIIWEFPCCDTSVDTIPYGKWAETLSNGAPWSDYFLRRTVGWQPPQIADLGLLSDTVSFGPQALESWEGFPPDLAETAWIIVIDSIHATSASSHICLDSTVYPALTNPIWVWQVADFSFLVPSWDGPHCFEIVTDCCENLRGNINLDLQDSIDISDLTSLVGWMFRSGGAPPCMLEADIDANGTHNITDLTYLVSYMFKSGPPPVGCP